MTTQDRPLSPFEFVRIVSRVTYPGVTFGVVGRNGLDFLQLTFEELDVITGTFGIQESRLWLLSGMTEPAQVVQTCLKALLTALEHEAREKFQYKGERILQPHLDLEYLVANTRVGRWVEESIAVESVEEDSYDEAA